MPSPNISAIVSFSRELRNAREFRSISLTEIAAKTRIELTHLEEIETAHWDAIPEGFLRGYIALYADAVGMNMDKVLRDFDSLVTPQKASVIAEIVKNNPLLRQPERVGLTRAKIAAAWFADLTAKTHLKPILLVLALIALFVGPAWIRSSLRQIPPEAIPISTIIDEYQSKTHGPITNIPLRNYSVEDKNTVESEYWATITTHDSGFLRYISDFQSSQALTFSRLETINIQFLKTISLEISPPRSANITLNNSQFRIDSTFTSSSAFYTCALPQTGLDPQYSETSVSP